jgi:hypothetical protein
MTVRFYPAKQGFKSRLIERFLMRHKVQHELVEREELSCGRNSLIDRGNVPALEVNGQLFIDPNDHALRKILAVEDSSPLN